MSTAVPTYLAQRTVLKVLRKTLHDVSVDLTAQICDPATPASIRLGLSAARSALETSETLVSACIQEYEMRGRYAAAKDGGPT